MHIHDASLEVTLLREEFGFASVMMRDDQAIHIYLFLFLYSGGLSDTIWVLFLFS